MTKLKTTVLMSIVVFMASCSSNKVLTQADTLVGAYDKSTTITDEEFSLFKTVMQSHSDLQLKPIKVSRQVVAGTNYKYECINENKRTVEVVIFQKALKKSAGGDIAVFFADYIWALPTFNNRWEVLFRCRWGVGVWW